MTKRIHVGGVAIGGGAPVSIQSMLNTKTTDVPACLAQLRAQKGVSAREMSLAIGQNSSYINRIENQRAFPSMQGFFYICEYLGVTPGAFFADPDAGGAEGVAGKFARLTPARQALVEALMDQLAKPPE